jgi:hypothetical protein
MPGEEPVRSGDFVTIHLVITGADVDQGELAFIFRLEVREDLLFVDLVAAPGDLFSTKAGFRSQESILLASGWLRMPGT